VPAPPGDVLRFNAARFQASTPAEKKATNEGSLPSGLFRYYSEGVTAQIRETPEIPCEHQAFGFADG